MIRKERTSLLLLFPSPCPSVSPILRSSHFQLSSFGFFMSFVSMRQLFFRPPFIFPSISHGNYSFLSSFVFYCLSLFIARSLGLQVRRKMLRMHWNRSLEQCKTIELVCFFVSVFICVMCRHSKTMMTSLKKKRDREKPSSLCSTERHVATELFRSDIFLLCCVSVVRLLELTQSLENCQKALRGYQQREVSHISHLTIHPKTVNQSISLSLKVRGVPLGFILNGRTYHGH